MKKLAIILLIAFYGLSASGAAIQLHYCCGKVADFSVGFEKSNDVDCEHGDKIEMPGCCADQQLIISLDDSQGISGGISAPLQSVVTLTDFTISISSSTPIARAKNTIGTRGPPTAPSVPIYIYNQVFRN